MALQSSIRRPFVPAVSKPGIPQRIDPRSGARDEDLFESRRVWLDELTEQRRKKKGYFRVRQSDYETL